MISIRPAILLAVLALSSLAGCAEKTVALSILTYNHSTHYYSDVSVNGAMAPNGAPIGPGEKFAGGGKTTCCIVLPAQWRPGLKVHVTWAYDRLQGDPTPLPPPQEADVEIPEYRRDPATGSIGRFFLHLYQDHQVRVVVNPYGPLSEYSPDPDKSPAATGRPIPSSPSRPGSPS